MTEFQQRLDDLIIEELRTREKSSTKEKLFFTTNVTTFAALLKSVPVGCMDFLLLPNLVKRSDVNCLTYNSNKNFTMTTFACYGLCVFIKQKTKGWRKRQRNSSMPMSLPTNICQFKPFEEFS